MAAADNVSEAPAAEESDPDVVVMAACAVGLLLLLVLLGMEGAVT